MGWQNTVVSQPRFPKLKCMLGALVIKIMDIKDSLGRASTRTAHHPSQSLRSYIWEFVYVRTYYAHAGRVCMHMQAESVCI